MKRKLPVLLERDLQTIRTERYVRSGVFAGDVRDEAEKEGRAVSCSSACSACCSHPIMVSLLEGILLYRWLAERGRWTVDLRERLQAHADATWALAHEVWFLSNIPCPFLIENLCSVHDGRPFVCRTTWSVGDPFYCAPSRFGLRTEIVPRADILGEFHRLEASKLKEHELPRIQFPLSKAVLVAEALVSGKLLLENIGSTLIKEYGAVG